MSEITNVAELKYIGFLIKAECYSFFNDYNYICKIEIP